jgi:hypothetical protein
MAALCVAFTGNCSEPAACTGRALTLYGHCVTRLPHSQESFRSIAAEPQA